MKTLVALLLATLPAFAGTVTEAEVGPGFGSANAYYTPLSCCGGLPDPDSISASAEGTFMTSGPVVQGFLEVTGIGGANEPGYADISIGSYNFECGTLGCILPMSGLPLPFTLGVPFEISVSASAGYVNSETAEAGAGDVSFDFSLFESYAPYPGAAATVGAEVETFEVTATPATVPEPATLLPVCLGLLWISKKSLLG